LDVDELSRYVSETGKILSRQYTRLSAKDQRQVAKLIKRARNMLRLQ
jgi:small subunit ribosomal protein S18